MKIKLISAAVRSRSKWSQIMTFSLPDGLDALVCASDLQRREALGGKPLGDILAEELEMLCVCDLLLPASRTGVLLCGDLYARIELDRLGGGAMFVQFGTLFGNVSNGLPV